eukprot:214549_1
MSAELPIIPLKIANLNAADIKKIFERYGYDRNIKYIPNAPSSNILQILSKANNVKHIKCLHHLYKTQQCFINHVLWILYPDVNTLRNSQYVKHNDKIVHVTCFGASLMCSGCVTLLLSMVSFDDLIGLYGVWMRLFSLFNLFISTWCMLCAKLRYLSPS